MDELQHFLTVFKGEPMAAFTFFAFIAYKIISEAINILKHKYFIKPDKLPQTILRDIAILKIYNEGLPVEDRMESLFDYLYAGYNGEVLDYGKLKIILPNKEKWVKLHAKKMEKKPEFDPKKNFQKAMEIIDRAVYDRSML
jgi:hypothetical protein